MGEVVGYSGLPEGQCSESKPVCREVAACCVLYPPGACCGVGGRYRSGSGLQPLSVGLSSSHELKADGSSLKCSRWRRQRQRGLWCNLIELGGW